MWKWKVTDLEYTVKVTAAPFISAAIPKTAQNVDLKGFLFIHL